EAPRGCWCFGGGWAGFVPPFRGYSDDWEPWGGSLCDVSGDLPDEPVGVFGGKQNRAGHRAYADSCVSAVGERGAGSGSGGFADGGGAVGGGTVGSVVVDAAGLVAVRVLVGDGDRPAGVWECVVVAGSWGSGCCRVASGAGEECARGGGRVGGFAALV